MSPRNGSPADGLLESPPARKLLVVTDEMEVGGSQRQISYLLRGIDHRQWQPELVFFRNTSFMIDELRAQGIRVHHVPKRGRFDPVFLFRYARLLKRGRYDIVHAYSLTAELWTLLAGLLTWPRAPLVASIRGMYLVKGNAFWWVKRFILRHSAAVISNAKAGVSAAASRAGMATSSFDVVPNGVDIPLAPTPAQKDVLHNALGVPSGATFALFVGRLVAQKNVACLLRAQARLAPADRPWLALAGDGPLRPDLEAMVDAAGLRDCVRFLGERTDVTALMQSADFLVLPSLHEGMPNVLLESMAAGCPIVASDVGGNPELVESGIDGLLFPNDDDLALSEHIKRMSSDTQLRSQLSLNARARALREHAIERMVASTVAVYERCLAPSGSNPFYAGSARPEDVPAAVNPPSKDA